MFVLRGRLSGMFVGSTWSVVTDRIECAHKFSTHREALDYIQARAVERKDITLMDIEKVEREVVEKLRVVPIL